MGYSDKPLVKRYEMLSFCVGLKSTLRSPCTTFWAEVTVFTAFFCRLALIGVGYRLDANKALATGLIMAMGISLPTKGWRVAAGADEEVHGAVNDAHGLYNVNSCFAVSVQADASPSNRDNSAEVSPLSAAVKTLFVLRRARNIESLILKVGKKEEFILDNRPTEGAAKHIPSHFGFGKAGSSYSTSCWHSERHCGKTPKHRRDRRSCLI